MRRRHQNDGRDLTAILKPGPSAAARRPNSRQLEVRRAGRGSSSAQLRASGETAERVRETGRHPRGTLFD